MGRAVVLRVVARDGKVVVAEVPEPELRAGEILVATRFSVISPGTERTIVAGTRHSHALHEYPEPGQTWPRIRSSSVELGVLLPRPPSGAFASLGYGLAGTVLKVAPDVTDLVPGDIVACAGSQCAFHAERVAVPRSLTVPVPPGLAPDLAAFVTLGAVALASLRMARLSLGESAVVLGAGVLGVLSAWLAAAGGISALCIEPRQARRALATTLGVETASGPDDPGALDFVHRRTDGFGADAALLAVTTEHDEVVESTLPLLRRGARVVLVGQMPLRLDRDRFFASGTELVTNSAYGPGRYDPVYEEGNVDFPIDVVRWTENRNMALVLALAAERRLDLASIPVARVPVAEAPAAYAALDADETLLTGILSYGQEP